MARSGVFTQRSRPEEARSYVARWLVLSRRRVDYCLLDELGERVEEGAAAPDADGLDGFARRVERRHGPMVEVRAAIESMTGTRFVHDTSERCGWEVEVAWRAGRLSRRELVPAIRLPTFAVRQQRERARRRLHLVKHRSAQAPRARAADELRARLPRVRPLRAQRARADRAARFRDAWRTDVLTAIASIDQLDHEIHAIERELRQLGAEHPYVALLQTVPGIARTLGHRPRDDHG